MRKLFYKINIFVPILLLIGFSIIAKAQETEEDKNMSKITINAASWMAGRWSGPGLGGVCEEVWSRPAGRSMMGMFRMVKDGRIGFYEFFIITEEDSSLVLKLKHFNPDLTGWEEKEKTIDFPLISHSADELIFDGLTYRKTGNDTMEAIVRTKQKDGTERELRFNYKRATNY